MKEGAYRIPPIEIREYFWSTFLGALSIAQNRILLSQLPFKFASKAENALNDVERACNERNEDLLEKSIILFAVYSRNAVDALWYALIIWLLDRLERRFNRKLITPKNLEILLHELSSDHLKKLTTIIGDDEALKNVENLEKHVEKLRRNPCWRLRNALTHGYPYRVDIRECNIRTPLTEHTLNIEDMKQFLTKIKEILSKLKELQKQYELKLPKELEL